MTDYIGAKLSLVSKSDIRYVGILHEIDSVNSTVSLEQVRSFGTEGESGRKGDPALEIPASDNVFEYIIFRGSDVKDLRVEQGATSQPPAPRQAPQDPAILQTGPTPQQQPHQQPHQQQQQQQQSYHQQPMPHRAPREFDGQQYGAPPPQGYGYGYPPPQHQQHFGGPPPQGYGYPPQNAPQPGFQQPQQEQGLFAPQPQNAFPDLPSDSQALPSAQQASQKKAPVKTEGEKPTQAKIVPALPLPGHAASPRPRTGKGVNDITKGINDLSTTPAAASASAASNGQAPKRNALLEVQRNMKSSTTTANNTVGGSPAPVPSVPEPVANAPATRSEPRSNNARRDPGIRQNGVIVNPNASIVIPKDEYDFSSANAKFSRDGLDSEVQAAPVYDKKSSFFDSISSEASDRGEGGGGRGRGREIRNQERTMNYETFGEDLAFRNNRGRGRGGRGRGRGRGRGASQPVQ